MSKIKKICKFCGRQFETEFNAKMYCNDSCAYAFRKQYWKTYAENFKNPINVNRKKDQDDHLEKTVAEISKYNAEHNTKYSYGQYMTLKFFGKVK